MRWQYLFVLAFLPVCIGPAAGQSGLVDVSGLAIPAGNGVDNSGLRPIRMKQRGAAQFVVRLKDDPLIVANGHNSKRRGGRLNGNQQRAYLAALKQKQDSVMGQISPLGGRELGRVSKSHNALIIAVDASRVATIRSLPDVLTVRPLIDYKLALSSTVPYIGAAAVHAAGGTGAGVVIAILDSGIDYTHRNLGGPGTVVAYQAAYGFSRADSKNTTLDGLFPTAKVIGGFDFVGENWPDGSLAFDPDPIDFDGHGTAVADIAAGRSLDGTHKGVAPDAKLLAVKTCSAISTSCSGLGLLLGMDFAVDPNRDGDISDAADVINLSLGMDYGQIEDDLTEVCTNAAFLGVVVVAAAGNGGDKPYIVGSPSISPAVISVAQTHVPGALTFPLIINAPASIAGSYPNTATVDWAPVDGGFSGPVAYVGRGCPSDSISSGSPADPYLTNPAGKVALIDRGACNVSLKVERAAQAGAIGVLIGLVVPGDAVTFSFGGGTTFVPTLVITQSTASLIKVNVAAPVLVSVSPASAISLVRSMVASSSRGPSYTFNSIKPDIGAPGASLTAVAGTGSGETVIGGTSGAAPMVAGAAALLVQAYPLLSPSEIKAKLMNTSESSIRISPALFPGILAPATWIGAGEVRVNSARASTTAAWDAEPITSTFSSLLSIPGPPSLSFDFSRNTELANELENKKRDKLVVVRNYSNRNRIYRISVTFRDPSDAASGAIQFSTPSVVSVSANGTATFPVTARIDPARLPVWTLNGGANGGNGSLLQNVEFDGQIVISDAMDTIHLPWQILPYKAANVEASATAVMLGGGTLTLTLSNKRGAVPGRVDAFSLTGTSEQLPSNAQPRPGDNFVLIDLRAVGVRLVRSSLGLAVQFAITTYGARAHPNYPAEFDVSIDVNRDGVDDYIVFNAENGGFAASGQNLTLIFNLQTRTVSAFFFTDADLNSSNAILTAPLAALGLTPSTQFNFRVLAGDNYFTGVVTDLIDTMTYQLDTPRFATTAIPAGGVPVDGSVDSVVSHILAGNARSPSQSGLLLMYRNARENREADVIPVLP